jgi:hypothetical protein
VSDASSSNLLPPADPHGDLRDNPDRSKQYGDTSPAVVLKQLNDFATSVRIRERAVADRDRVIHDLHDSVAARDKAIKQLNDRLRYAKIRVVMLYALVGGIAAKGAEELIMALVKLFLAWVHPS